MTAETGLIRSEAELVGVALGLGAASVGRWSTAEAKLRGSSAKVADGLVDHVREAISVGLDPLGNAFCSLRRPAVRRPMGATYTSAPIIDAMVASVARRPVVRVVDPGAGSGRFILAAGQQLPDARLVAVEIDPLAAIILRANLRVTGLDQRTTVFTGDYRELRLPAVKGPTLFIGNPPYVRHHQIGPQWKAWLVDASSKLGLRASQLAGLHVHFMLATALLARPGDLGVLITSAEWLDVNYGSLSRSLFLGSLSGTAIHLIEPTAAPFEDADTTAAITCFEVGAKPRTINLRRIESAASLHPLAGGLKVKREVLQASTRWTPLSRPPRERPSGYVELGELCRVHRGQVTGANKIWIEGQHSRILPESVLHRAITKARELFAAGPVLADPRALKRVIDIPADLDELPARERKVVAAFLDVARKMGGAEGFIATHRKSWWSVGLHEPAPILATYMARRPPAFVRNLAGVRHINIAHGIYPRVPLPDHVLDALARFLSSGTSVDSGRTYAGGLTKFEPKEMERLLVPSPDLLQGAAAE
ncbi:MAG: class I SAM-dependent methyltransferase [Polyangiaceae bacterium]|nr:class I SAM-dependent methyltransferase [Polyangiaceae bacterium]